MKLSEARVRILSKKIAKELTQSMAVRSTGGSDDLAEFVARVFMVDQRREAEIDAEAREMLARQKNLPPPGTGEHQAAYQQARRAIAVRRGFVL